MWSRQTSGIELSLSRNLQPLKSETPPMKITDLQIILVANPPPHFGGLYFNLTTDGGHTGL